MANQFYFSALGDPLIGLTAAILILEAYERDLRSKNCLSEEKIGKEPFNKLVFRQYVTQCLEKGYVTEEALPESKEKWGQENFDKFPALRIEAINMAFNRCCAKAEICPKPTKEPALSSLPSYTTRTFAKPHPITPCAPKIPDISEGNRSIIEPRALTSGVDKKKEFQEALMAHLARKARG